MFNADPGLQAGIQNVGIGKIRFHREKGDHQIAPPQIEGYVSELLVAKYYSLQLLTTLIYMNG